ncbi:MAG TPA: TolC family protein [Opitutaceae bacterium]|nr:TolC family protein [Lacunisphaera sp.]HWA09135.1 TolC family protein [Opitutaceae bacterium]
MSRRIVLFYISILPVLAIAVKAGEPLSLDAAVQRALAQNRELAASALGAEAARGRVEQAGLRPNPSLEAGAQTDLLTGNNGARKFDLGITQAIPLGNRLREAQAVARVGIGAATAALDDRRRLLVGEVTKLYVELLAIDEEVALRERLIKVNSRFVELARSKAKVGEISVVEVNAAALEQAKLEQERAGLAAERENRLQDLKPLLGLAPEEDIATAGDLETLTSALKATADGDKPTWNRPDLRVAALAIEQVVADQRLAQVEAKGDLTVGATYGYDRQTFGDPDHLLGVKMSIPLPFRNKNQGRLRELRAERTRAQREAEALEFKVASEVASARQRVAQAQKILDGYRAAVLPLGEESERTLVAAYQQGQVPLFQVIQGQQQRLALESGALAASAAYATALAELQTATGRSPRLATTTPAEQP